MKSENNKKYVDWNHPIQHVTILKPSYSNLYTKTLAQNDTLNIVFITQALKFEAIILI